MHPPSPQRIRLLATDVDGTLLNRHHLLSPGNRAAVRRVAAAGIEIALVTGRRHSYVLPIALELEADVHLITSNGALIRSLRGGRAGPVLFRNFLPKAEARAVLRALPEFRGQAVVTFARDDGGELVLESPTEAQRYFAGWLDHNRAAVTYHAPLETCLDTDPVQLMFGGTIAQMDRAVAQLSASPAGAAVRMLRTTYPQRDLGILDVLHRDVNKGAAVAALADSLRIASSGVLALGDNFNDLEMLEYAGTAVLMGNAHPEMDRPGWHRTVDHDADGVAVAVRTFLGM